MAAKKKTPKKAVAKKKAAKKKTTKDKKKDSERAARKATKAKNKFALGKMMTKEEHAIAHSMESHQLDPLLQLPETKHNLHQKKLLIMEDIPITPCTALLKDKRGIFVPYTKAEKIFATYSKKCREKKLVVRMLDCRMTRTPAVLNNDGKIIIPPRSRAVCKFEIEDTESGQSETFFGSGLGDNDVWSDNSAQTVAMKQGLIMYFFAAWPDPANHLDLIREELAGQSAADFVAGIKAIMPEKGSKDAQRLNAEGAMKAIMEFFADY